MKTEGAPMPAHIPTQPTPTLDAMYSQGQQPYQQPGGQQQNQQDFTQQPHSFPANQQMPQDPQMLSQQQQGPLAMPFDQGMYTGRDPQNPQYPQETVSPNQQQNQGAQYPAFDTAATAWEQEHVTEVNNDPPFTGFSQQGEPHISQNQAARDAELHSARQRIQALDAARERQETLQAIAISAREATDSEELEEQLLSLDAWKQDIRRQIEGQGQASQANVAYDDNAYAQMAVGMRQQGAGFSDPRGGNPIYSPNANAARLQFCPASSIPFRYKLRRPIPSSVRDPPSRLRSPNSLTHLKSTVHAWRPHPNATSNGHASLWLCGLRADAEPSCLQRQPYILKPTASFSDPNPRCAHCGSSEELGG